jgi:hypothetical protein
MNSFLHALEQFPFSVWVRESSSIWAFPMFLVAHTIGMAIVAGCSVMMSLAFLGFWPPHAPVKPLERMYPVMWAGFWINAVTGIALLVADAASKLTNPDFYVKMVFVFAGVYLLGATRKHVFADPQLDQGPLPVRARTLAWVSLLCWFGAILAGRLLAYVGPVSGLAGSAGK